LVWGVQFEERQGDRELRRLAEMMTMKCKTAAVAPMTMRAIPSNDVTPRVRTTPAKPMGIAATLHAPATHPAHKQAAVKQSSSAQQAARLARRDRVVLEHLPLVKAIAVRVHENLPVHVDLDDLVHAGILGLFDAANKYNPEKQVVFSSYAKHRIKGAILDSLRQLDWASRDMRRRHKQVEAATRDLAVTLQRNPTEAEVAEKLGMDVERWRTMMLDLRNVGLISASTRSNENEDLPAPDFPSKPETQPDSICARTQLRSVLGDAMKTLPERYQKVVVLYYTNEMTMKEIGGILGINESRVSQIHKSALEKMMAVLQQNGIMSSQAF
jgi:RNA polymerase sigma factor for flagellar operon FliA